MKTSTFLAGLAGVALTFSACDLSIFPSTDSPEGCLSLCFSPQSEFCNTRAGESAVDTNSFLLTVKSSAGDIIYDGRFADSPLNISVKSGDYTVYARSMDFSEPLFDSPQYADEQCVSVKSGQSVGVTLLCSQVNSGVRLIVDSKFRTAYPKGLLYLKSSEGKLIYGYTEKRIAYFQPGTVVLSLVDNDEERTLLTRKLNAREILSLSISSTEADAQSSGIHIAVDTSRIWESDNYTDGAPSPGEDVATALSVSAAKEYVGSKGVWVYGYIVGTSTSTSKSEFEAPFSTATNLVIASRTSVSDRSECLSVELSKGDPRDALNLKDHPENRGKQVFLKGDIEEKYYGLPGIKNITDFVLKD